MPFVDPRSNPSPPCPPARSLAEEPDEILPLILACLHGHIYKVEEWIAADKPLQAQHYRAGPRKVYTTPLQAAYDKENHDLALLLLCNGYDISIEPCSILALAVRDRRYDFIDLMVKWGDKYEHIDPEDVFRTYDAALIDRLWKAGVNFCKGQALTWHVGEHVNRPLLGWIKNHLNDEGIADQLAKGLRLALSERKEFQIQMLIWVGADLYRSVPNIRWSSSNRDEEEDERSTAIDDLISGDSCKYLKNIHLVPEGQ